MNFNEDNLYITHSDQLAFNVMTGNYDQTLNFGLFSFIAIRRNQYIATYNGILRTKSEMRRRIRENPNVSRYRIYMNDHYDLDCYKDIGIDNASYANCPHNCINGITGQVSVSNAYMAYVEDNEGNHIGVEIYASKNITSNTEILVDYGNEYVYP